MQENPKDITIQGLVRLMSNAAMHVAKTGVEAQQLKMQVIANNLANVNTTGFKKDRVNFETLVYQVKKLAGAQTSEGTEATSGLNVGTGVRIVSTEKMFSQGSIAQTDNALDLAISGGGFFQIILPDGQFGYSRDGSFSRNGEGILCTADGFVLQPQITIPPNVTNISIGGNGAVSVNLPGQNAPTNVGQIQLATFINPTGLAPIGSNFLKETNVSGAATLNNPMENGSGKLVQGSLENSNVKVVQELVNMIETQRAYEVSSKAITATDEMLRYINQNL